MVHLLFVDTGGRWRCRNRSGRLILVTIFCVALVAAATVVRNDKNDNNKDDPTSNRINLVQCSPDLGGGVCPAANTCCAVSLGNDSNDGSNDGSGGGRGGGGRRRRRRRRVISGCIPSDLGKFNATCCDDLNRTACGVHYECKMDQTSYLDLHPEDYYYYYYCQASHAIQDPLVQRLPRYFICTEPTTKLLKNVYGLPVNAECTEEETCGCSKTSNKDPPKNGGVARLAYYSTHGDIVKIMNATLRQTVEIAIVAIHGAARNADDYFCSMVAAAELESSARNSSNESIRMVVAPWFAQLGDVGVEPLIGGGEALRWQPSQDGTWRYGANAVYPPPQSSSDGGGGGDDHDHEHNRQISSFRAMDALMLALSDTKRFPNLHRIVVAGHSSGGQFVQRWTLLTPIWDHKRFRAVVANPSSYSYLTPKRFLDGEWNIPQPSITTKCPGYNQWTWGLEPGGEYSVPYMKNVMSHMHLTFLTQRFSQRNTVYLAGDLDACNVSGNSRGDWCYSHGLETTCGDQIQGSNRWERHCRYYQSLLLQPEMTANRDEFARNHHSVVVKGVGHDHSLIFTSPEGLFTLFGSNSSCPNCYKVYSSMPQCVQKKP